MVKFIVTKSEPLNGSVAIAGSKNSVLPILAATLLTDEKCIIRSVTPFNDVYVMSDIIKNLGEKTEFDENKMTFISDSSNITSCCVEYEQASKIRASFLVAGPLLAKYKKVKIPLPGGCPIGSRPVDLHLKGFGALGAKIKQEHGYVELKARCLKGNRIYLDFPSVGATENLMMAATLAQGTTIIENAAAEPEICDLAIFLNKMGAKITGAGGDTIKIKGVEKLGGANHKVIPDRIEAGTYMIAAAITGGDVVIKNVIAEHIKPIIAKFQEINIKTELGDNYIRVFNEGKYKGTNVKTLPFPGFPTDMQAQFMSLLSLCDGTSIITETVFENRFMHAAELIRMGADIKVEGQTAIIKGVKKLTGTQVNASDLRAGAALVISALSAEGKTEISGIEHIERGYYNIDKKLRGLGALIEKVEN